MMGSRLPQKLHVLLAVLAIFTALSVSAAVMEKPSSPAQSPAVAKAAQAVPNASAAALPSPVPTAPTPGASLPGKTAGPRPDGSSPAAPSGPIPSVPAAPRASTGEAVGRSNPFAVPAFAQPPARSGMPGFGLDLPLPPGATVPLAPVAPPPPPPPGAGMTVGAIIGGSERVAIVQKAGQIFVVSVGDHVEDAAVVEIRDDKVVLRKGEVIFDVPYGGGTQ